MGAGLFDQCDLCLATLSQRVAESGRKLEPCRTAAHDHDAVRGLLRAAGEAAAGRVPALLMGAGNRNAVPGLRFGWDARDVARRLLLHLLAVLLPNGEVVIGIDDTIERR